jgi:hypothetical protein
MTGASFHPTDTHTKAYAGIGSQAPLPTGVAAVPEMHKMPEVHLGKASFSGCLVAAAQHCGRTDEEIAPDIPMSQSYMSRFMRGVAEKWAKRLVSFMRVTQSIAPLQWIACQMGCVVMLDPKAAEKAALQARLRELEAA